MQALESRIPSDRIAGAIALGRMGFSARESVPSLRKVLADTDAIVRQRAAEALGLIGAFEPEVLADLVACFRDPYAAVAGAAAGALGKSGPAGAEFLARALGDTLPSMRRGAAVALQRMGGAARDVIPAFTAALRDPDDNVRYIAAIALGNFGRRAVPAVPVLLRLLADPDEGVRREVAAALGKLVPEAPRPLIGESAVPEVVDSLAPALMKELHVPGVAIALMSSGRLAWSRNYGLADVRQRIPVTDSTIFEACSMSKPVFATLVMMLVREGRLDLDRPLARYLDEPEVFTQLSYKLITARMVLSHTSGLPNWRKGDEEWGGPLPVEFTPGTKFLYSGEGYYYLQRVVEKITGESLERLADRMLFTPLGMQHATFVWTADAENKLSSGHSANGEFRRRTRYRNANAAYTLYISAPDYVKFLLEVIRTGEEPGHLFPVALLDSMAVPRVRVEVREAVERPGRAKGKSVFWTMGWSLNTTEEGAILHHSGANGSGFRCFVQFDRVRGSALLIMTNGMNGGELWTRLVSVIGDW
jgi:CubicO group peptidase (beta-lactamase class C family)